MTTYNADRNNFDEVFQRMIDDIFDRMGKYDVVIDCPYAKDVEYGADPAEISNSTEMTNDDGDDITVRNKEIRDWVSRKFGLMGKDRKRVGDQIYKNILIEGTAPQPFYRPAKHRMEREASSFSTEIFRSDEPNRTVAEMVKMYMLENMMYKDIKDTGRLMHSIRVEQRKNVFDRVIDMREDVERSDTLNYKGEEDRRTRK